MLHWLKISLLLLILTSSCIANECSANETLIKSLGHPQWIIRERAYIKLKKLEGKAFPALVSQLYSEESDKEIRRNLKDLIEFLSEKIPLRWFLIHQQYWGFKKEVLLKKILVTGTLSSYFKHVTFPVIKNFHKTAAFNFLEEILLVAGLKHDILWSRDYQWLLKEIVKFNNDNCLPILYKWISLYPTSLDAIRTFKSINTFEKVKVFFNVFLEKIWKNPRADTFIWVGWTEVKRTSTVYKEIFKSFEKKHIKRLENYFVINNNLESLSALKYLSK